jgi:ParB family chromosome partitioning protein
VSAGHARALLALPEPEAAMREVIARGLSVRQTEALGSRQPTVPSGEGEPNHGPDAIGLERLLAERLGLRVKVTFDGKRGYVQIHYMDLDQLDNLLKKLAPTQ